MESFPGILPFFAGLLLVALTYTTYKRRNVGKNTANKLPEPSGALPIIGHVPLLKPDVHPARLFGDLSDKYGPIFGLRIFGQRMLVVSNTQMIKECLATNDANFSKRPDVAYGKYVFYNFAGFAATQGPYWREIRKMVTVELFTKQAVDKHHNIRNSEIHNALNELYLKTKDRKSSFVFNQWVEDLVFNINIRTVFGKRSSPDSAADDMHVVESFRKAFYLMGSFVPSDFFPSLEWLDIGGKLKAMKQVAKEIDGYTSKCLDQHAQKKRTQEDGSEKEPDFMDAMLSVIDKYDGMNGHGREIIIKSTAQILMMAGSESTYETLLWAIAAVLNNPHVLEAARKEIDMKIGRERWVEESDIKNLPYLEAIVKEVLRLYPSGPLGATHEAFDDCIVGGYHIPKGTLLSVNIWKLHRDPKLWPEPEEFRPERFLGEKSELNFQGQNFDYLPFGSGRRMCPGNLYAVRVVQLGLARILQGFDISAPMGKPVDMREGLGISLPMATPLEAIVSPRLSAELYQVKS